VGGEGISRQFLHPFDRIIENLTRAVEHLDIVVRVNLDRSNPTAALALPEILEHHGLLRRYPEAATQASDRQAGDTPARTVRLSLAPVSAPGREAGACGDIRDRCLGDEEFAALQVEVYEQLVDQGFLEIVYPALSGGHCTADSVWGFVIAPDGSLLKCWEELGSDSATAVGSVHATSCSDEDLLDIDLVGDPAHLAHHHRYLGWDPFEKTGCRDCHVLPLCMGGCPHKGLALADADRGACSSWRFNLEQMLHLRYRCDQRLNHPEEVSR
jgi:uncharacterized protein